MEKTSSLSEADARTDRASAAAKLTLPFKVLLCLGASAALLAAGGCGPLSGSSTTELEAFKEAGPINLNVDVSELLEASADPGPYRPVPGDVLEFQMPPIIMPDLTKPAAKEEKAYLCRVDTTGHVVLPILGEVGVIGRTLSEIETFVANLYWPKYVLEKPSIVVRVAVFKTAKVSVAGAVKAPGTYELRSDQMTLIAALMQANGIAEGGATNVYVRSAGTGQKAPPTKIPVVGMNIPSINLALNDGDTIVVEALEPQVITVIGLVNSPGVFPWSHNKQCDVMDALAYAGGINDIADPQFVKVYRQDGKTGKVVCATLKLDSPSAVGASNVFLKPGDVVAVEQTARTRTRLILASVVRIGLGVNAGAGITAGR